MAYLQLNANPEINYPTFADRHGLVHAQVVAARARSWAIANMGAATFSAEEVE